MSNCPTPNSETLHFDLEDLPLTIINPLPYEPLFKKIHITPVLLKNVSPKPTDVWKAPHHPSTPVPI